MQCTESQGKPEVIVLEFSEIQLNITFYYRYRREIRRLCSTSSANRKELLQHSVTRVVRRVELASL